MPKISLCFYTEEAGNATSSLKHIKTFSSEIVYILELFSNFFKWPRLLNDDNFLF